MDRMPDYGSGDRGSNPFVPTFTIFAKNTVCSKLKYLLKPSAIFAEKKGPLFLAEDNPF